MKNSKEPQARCWSIVAWMNALVFLKRKNLADALNSVFWRISGDVLQRGHLCMSPCALFSAFFSPVLWDGLCGWDGHLQGDGRGLDRSVVQRKTQGFVRGRGSMELVSLPTRVGGCARSSALPEGKKVLFSPSALHDSTTQELCQISRVQRALFGGLVGNSPSPTSLAGGWAPWLATASGERARGCAAGLHGRRGPGTPGTVLLNPCLQATFLWSPPCHPSPSPFT